LINLTIKQQLLLVTIIPILGLLYLSFNIINTSNNDKNNLLKVDKYLNYTVQASNLIHQLQIERGMNSGFLQSNGKKFQKEILLQRDRSDQAYIKLNKYITHNQIENKANILDLLMYFKKDSITLYRVRLDNLKTNSYENVKLYSERISQIINTINYLQTLNKSKSLSQYALSYISLIHAKENAGQERAIINSIIVSKKLLTKDIQTIFILSTSQKNYINSFKSLSSKKLLNFYNLKIDTANTAKVNNTRSMILANYEKYNIISQMKSHAGYGGLIHNFKNYLLRYNNKYKLQFYKNYNKLLEYIELYKKLPKNIQEKKYLDRIQHTFTLYKDNIEKISNAHKKNQPVQFIDTMIQINDTQAIHSFAILSNNIVGLDVYEWFKISTQRINALNQVENEVFKQLFKKIEKNKTQIFNEIRFQLIYISLFLFIIIFLSVFIYNNITSQIKVFQNGLLLFFEFVNKEADTYELLNEKTNNEFGHMSKVLNKGIHHIVSHIEDEIHEAKQQEKIQSEMNKIRSLGELLGNLAHQWRQPLSVITTGITGMKIQKEYGVLQDKDFYKNCDIINDSAQNLSKTIDDFQNFMISNSQKELFNIKENINDFLSLVEGSIKEHNITIIMQMDDNIHINSYSNELTQVLLNIFNNAKDALQLKNKLINKLIFIKAIKINDTVAITMRDNAGGISPEIISKVFEPYVTTKHQSQGTGLGLHMSYNLIVDGMKGTIEAHNIKYTHEMKTYIGAEFRITLPIS
jgi:signal transduction histidine kinase